MSLPLLRWVKSAAKERIMIKELDRVVLTADLPEHSLMSGDIGTVVLIHREGFGFEVEFSLPILLISG